MSCPTRATPSSSWASPQRVPVPVTWWTVPARSRCSVSTCPYAPRSPTYRTSPPTTYLVHGEESASETLRERIGAELGWTAVGPRSGEAVLVRRPARLPHTRSPAHLPHARPPARRPPARRPPPAARTMRDPP
ncbi:MBL fold metallo-hydrolase RNA specificity domain-containing protein [Streptomyces yangpuensis]|uniref:MBL fold metallo-hydrolase RNA specificity domain-containing protein n=1 Tax=Streptomyces yangpuensis TaxID=1648182 RepID=UPI0037FB6F4A